MASTSAAFEASQPNASAMPPSPRMISAVSSAAAALMSAQSTLAPSRANSTAVALPLPQPGPIDPAPPTSAVLPARRPAICVLLCPAFALLPAAVALAVEAAQFGLEDLAVIVLWQRLDEYIFLG